MSNYSPKEIAEFKAKDLRITKLAILKSLIEKLDLEKIYDVQEVIELSEKYVGYVYKERSTKGGDAECVEWEQIAIGLNLAIPNSQNIKILNQVLDEYKKATKASANPKATKSASYADILVHIINTFGKYPTKTESMSKVVKSLLGD